MNNYEPGDILQDKWGDYRIIILTNDVEKTYHFIDYGSDESVCPGYFFSPTRSCLSKNAFEKYKKVGKLPDKTFEKMIIALGAVVKAHNDAFVLCHETIGKNKEFAIDKFINK